MKLTEIGTERLRTVVISGLGVEEENLDSEILSRLSDVIKSAVSLSCLNEGLAKDFLESIIESINEIFLQADKVRNKQGTDGLKNLVKNQLESDFKSYTDIRKKINAIIIKLSAEQLITYNRNDSDSLIIDKVLAEDFKNSESIALLEEVIVPFINGVDASVSKVRKALELVDNLNNSKFRARYK